MPSEKEGDVNEEGQVKDSLKDVAGSKVSRGTMKTEADGNERQLPFPLTICPYITRDKPLCVLGKADYQISDIKQKRFRGSRNFIVSHIPSIWYLQPVIKNVDGKQGAKIKEKK